MYYTTTLKKGPYLSDVDPPIKTVVRDSGAEELRDHIRVAGEVGSFLFGGQNQHECLGIANTVRLAILGLQRIFSRPGNK